MKVCYSVIRDVMQYVSDIKIELPGRLDAFYSNNIEKLKRFAHLETN